MKAVGLYEYLDIHHPNALLDVEVAQPQNPSGHDLLIQINAVSVNPVDYKVRSPKSKIELEARILGWDAVGTVVAVGDQACHFKKGDQVFYAGDITRPGSNAQFQLVDERIVGYAPKTLSAAEAAVLPLTAITAYELLFERCNICKNGGDAGKSILIIGSAGGVGSIAIQLAKQFAKLNVIATASRVETHDWVRKMGADHVINHHDDLAEQLKTLGFDGLNGTGVDYVLILNTNDAYLPQLAQIIAPFGKIASITESMNPQNLDAFKMKSVSFIWEFMFTKSMYQTPDLISQHRILNFISKAVDQGKLKTTLTQHLGQINAHNLIQAHQILESGQAIGKLALEGFAP